MFGITEWEISHLLLHIHSCIDGLTSSDVQLWRKSDTYNLCRQCDSVTLHADFMLLLIFGVFSCVYPLLTYRCCFSLFLLSQHIQEIRCVNGASRFPLVSGIIVDLVSFDDFLFNIDFYLYLCFYVFVSYFKYFLRHILSGWEANDKCARLWNEKQ